MLELQLPPLPDLTDREKVAVRSRQEHELLRLGDQLNLKGGLEAALAHFTMDVELSDLLPSAVPDKWFGVTDIAANNKEVEDFYNHYFAGARENGIHDYAGYATTQLMMDRLTSQLTELGLFSGPKPLVANIPTGGIAAMIDRSPDYDRAIMFYPAGLYLYLGDFCKVAAQMFHPLPPELIKSDHDLMHAMGVYEDQFYGLGLAPLSPRIGVEFAHALANSCLEDHTIRQERRQVGRESRFLSMMLNNYAQMFVFAHELGHQELGHLNVTNPTPERFRADEIAADRYAIEAVCATSANEHGSAALGYWGAIAAMLGFEALNNALIFFDGRSADASWKNTHYPPVELRRNALQKTADQFLDRNALAASIQATNLMKKALHYIG
ncbi:MAG: hypothetical protein AAGE61_18575, partial [Pseudomonadota bacterium]